MTFWATSGTPDAIARSTARAYCGLRHIALVTIWKNDAIRSVGVAPVAGFRSMQEYIGPAFEVVGEALGQLRDAWNALTGSSKDSTKATSESTSAWRSLGEFLGQVLGGVVTVITLAFAGLIKVVTAVIWVVNTVKDAFIAAGTWIGETAAKIYLWFTETLPNAISNAVATVVGLVLLGPPARDYPVPPPYATPGGGSATFATGEVGATGLVRSADPVQVQAVQDWLDEFERVQWILRLSPRLRRIHGD